MPPYHTNKTDWGYTDNEEINVILENINESSGIHAIRIS